MIIERKAKLLVLKSLLDSATNLGNTEKEDAYDNQHLLYRKIATSFKKQGVKTNDKCK